MDAAEVIALGANVVAVPRPLLTGAIESAAAALDWLHRFIEALRSCLPGCGAANLSALGGVGVTSIP